MKTHLNSMNCLKDKTKRQIKRITQIQEKNKINKVLI